MKWLKSKTFLYPGIFAIFFTLAIFLFRPALFDDAGTLQWDAREVHLTNLIFSSSSWRDGFSPLWTPYIFSGFPQIADLQVAVFYPANLVIGLLAVFSQKIIFWQLALHYALAGFGMFLLARYLTQNSFAGIFAGVAYMFSGFMIGHASHLGMQNTAAWLPIVFFLAMRALDKHSWRWAVLAGTAAGVMILAGHFQMAVFALFALGLYLIFNLFVSMYSHIWRGRVSNNENVKQFSNFKPKTNSYGDSWESAGGSPTSHIGLWAVIVGMTFLISAVQLLPTFELTKQSQRAGIPLEMAQTESLNPKSLWSIIIPNHQNVSEGEYQGPWDRTQNDLFLGKIIIIFALLGIISYWIPAYAGMTKRYIIFFLITLAMVALLYSLGRYGFLHQYFYLLPFFNKMRAPSNMMLIFDFAIILLAALGLNSLKKIIPRYFKIIALAAIALLIFEILPQAVSSELLYAKKDPKTTFEKPWIVKNTLHEYSQLSPLDRFKLYRVPELERNLAQVFQIYDFGGYNPLALKRQALYEDAMVKNPDLIDLAGIKYLPCQYIKTRENELRKVENLCVNDSYFPRAFLADRFALANNDKEALSLLGRHDLRSIIILEQDAPPPLGRETSKLDISRPSDEIVILEGKNPNEIQLEVASNKPALLFIGQTYYPGWQAKVNGRAERVLRANYLFQAILVPEGHSDVTLKFTAPPSLKLGAFLSIIGVIVVLMALIPRFFCHSRESGNPVL